VVFGNFMKMLNFRSRKAIGNLSGNHVSHNIAGLKEVGSESAPFCNSQEQLEAMLQAPKK